MNLIDESVAQKAQPEVYINNGRIEYKLNFKCAHEEVEVMNGEVLCRDCDNNEMTGEEEVSLLESYADLQHANAEDR